MLAYICMALGIALLAAPQIAEWGAERETRRLLAEAELAAFHRQPPVDTAVLRSYEELSRLLELEEEEPAGAEQDQADADHDTVTSGEPVELQRGEAPAIIEIPSIQLKLPILAGATDANMKSAAAHLTETDPLGQAGNAAVAAHRVRTKGRLFNRLDEVQIGDHIIIRTPDDTYTYTVYQTSIVEPTDVSVLMRNGDEKLLTLITCDPIENATHRLIVHAKIITSEL